MSKKILKENLIYQGLYQLIRVLTPIITIPIISRAFGPDGVGIINYSYSIIQYFLLFANVGIQLYFNKLIAECEIESVEISRRFWNIFVSKLIMSLSILVIYFIFICIFVEDNRLIFLIQGIYILGVLLDVSWFYAGIEKFKIASLSNMIASMFVLISVIFIINNKEDMNAYVFILSSATVINQLPLILNLKNYIKYIHVDWNKVIYIIKQSFRYILANGYLFLYTVIANVILGISQTYEKVGIFANTLNILMVAIIFINTIDLVMIPRMIKLSTIKNENIPRTLLENNINIQIAITIPMALGMVGIMPGFYSWFFGDEFYETVSLMNVVAILLVIVPLNMLISRQYLMLNNKLKFYNITVLFGIAFNLLLSIALIPSYGIYGAAIARIMTEAILLILNLKELFKEQIQIYFDHIFKSLIASLIMYGIVIWISNHFPNVWYYTICNIFCGIFIYLVISMLLKNKYIVMLYKNLI
ncbi:hypothetical protein GCM10010896_03710 [Mammaliicoccus stepanovicii]|uniref:AmrA n=3 Tax=Mammaliicoccus stepanovicii TaxID=643214 RepID=A0A240A577_9STAP|nr:oligosaccharide flippase family protein [Mammaliicoccus stepanovicii]GGI39503.1 hypothetical protein GCM10010896_03710 [Mammaliicoccus stepanovicii]SNV78234.1 AmrA [Mammaliicoccus stepanovicii]